MLDQEKTELQATSQKPPATTGIQELLHAAPKGKKKLITHLQGLSTSDSLAIIKHL